MANSVRVLVMGGGVAGITAATALNEMGARVLVVEKGPFMGGHAANLTCKATEQCLKCNDCLVEETLKKASNSDPFEIMTGTEIRNIEAQNGRFEVSLRSGPKMIDPVTCTGCGVCLEKCPEAFRNAIISAPSHHLPPFYAIDPERFTCQAPEDAALCRKICPEGAIHPEAKETTRSIQVDGIVVATGYAPFDPSTIRKFNFPRLKNMITAMELEKMRRYTGEIRGFSKDPVRKIAFVQCVGSRDQHFGNDYCSRICCGYASRTALKLIHEDPALEITFFYMDLQDVCAQFQQMRADGDAGIRFIRGLPGDFYAADKDRISVSYYDEARRRSLTEIFDMVVLSVGLSPSPIPDPLRDSLGISLNEDGFLLRFANEKGRSVVVAGTAEGPRDVSESINHAERAAFELARTLNLINTPGQHHGN